MVKTGYGKSSYDNCVYFKKISVGEYIYFFMLVAWESLSEITKLKKLMNDHFEMKDLGVAKKILGINIIRDKKQGRLLLSRYDYVEKIV